MPVTFLGVGGIAVSKATSFLPEWDRAVGKRVTADQPGVQQCSTGFPIMTPLNMTQS